MMVKTGVTGPKGDSEISADNRRLALKDNLLFHWRFTPHTLQAPWSGRRGWCRLRWWGGGQPHVSAIVCYTRNSTGRPCRAVRHSSSASRFRRRVRPPWFCSWPMSPWKGSPTPRRGPGLRWRTPLSHFPGLLCSPPRWPALSHT